MLNNNKNIQLWIWTELGRKYREKAAKKQVWSTMLCIAHPAQLHVMNLQYKQINFKNLKIQNQVKIGSFHPFVVPPRVLPQISNAEPRSEALPSGSGGSGVNDWGRFVNRAKHWYVHGFTCPPSGSIISYQGMRSVCLHSVGLCVCAATGANLPVAASPEAGSWRRPSVCFVLTSPFANNT